MDTAPLLTYYAKLMKTGPTHTHIPDTDPLTIPAFQVIGHNKQFLGLNQFHLPPQPPTTYKAVSTNYKPSNNDNNYTHPLGKSFVILLVERLILVHIQVTCATCSSRTTTCDLRVSKLADNLKHQLISQATPTSSNNMQGHSIIIQRCR
jgi:hypothetical protein